ncbi:hypothetical protein QKU48_gp0693 [Fadolivirus algeromassiliense]|jgi:hypothetical protein|uniref:Uncharacterized protein n=1 Tax=Fadolivirus FV1/VV64 TaxID=3070911 RepID=A0A7D3UUH6_9VIRU|nr:hypothetical protein QKU48_gp0693 [Fadolivirus algeromassiliense]QKF94151.1 hypothetical protein Fadolivirus_1_693 [Fadolivirus FV1/VV64]
MSDKLYKLALLVVFILAIIQIYLFFVEKPMIIEAKYEHMNPSLLTHQYENLAAEPGVKPEIDYYVKENRYDSEQKYTPKLRDPLSTQPRLGCGPKFDWDVNLNPGANNTYGDLLWHETSPRMVMNDNCIGCKNFTREKSYNEPTGVASDLTSSYAGSSYEGSLDEHKILPEEFKLYNKAMSCGNGSGLPPLTSYDGRCNVK